MLKRIAVADLCLGMYINEFCGSWMEHPFWKAKFVLDNHKDLQRIIDSGVDELWIDTTKGVDLLIGQHADSEAEVAAQVEARLLEVATAPVFSRSSLDEEIRRAHKLCGAAKQAVVAMFSEV
ncbi:MAG: DUF3391 domain-containing protein, partial [Pseudomonadaceae bacterium]|nr:DUF3391 domain-containing protein [Pseudomonadaceae bacterium]